MELVDAARLEQPALLGGRRGGHEPAGFRVLIEAFEQPGEPIRHAGAAFGAEVKELGEVGDRQDAGHDGHRDPRLAGALDEAQVNLDVEEVLGDGPTRPGVDLAFQVIEVGLGTDRLGMGFGEGRDADLEIGYALEPGDQVVGAGIASGMGRVAVSSGGGIAPERDDVAHARFPIAARDCVHLLAGGADAGEMGGRLEPGLPADARDRGMGAIAGRAAGAVSDRNEARGKRLQPLDRRPQLLGHLIGLRREELERDLERRRRR